MSNLSKLMQQAAAGAAGGEATYVDDVFSTYVYDGTAASHTITNGINLADEGGLIWTKQRGIGSHNLNDTERGVGKYLTTNGSGSEGSDSLQVTSYNTDGYTLGADTTQGTVNYTYSTGYSSWTFRKAPGFFDVVTYTGNATAGRTVSHNLGCKPGMIIIKATSGTYGTSNWGVYHKSGGKTKYLQISETDGFNTLSTFWNNTSPTSTEFTLGTSDIVNGASTDYVAYLFADGDDADAQIFGTDGDESIIKMGSYTGNGSNDGPEINLGWEPQWILIKRTSNSGDWILVDTTRGINQRDKSKRIYPNKSDGEDENERAVRILPKGFSLAASYAEVNFSGNSYVYVAIRRPNKPAEEFDATDLFAIDTGDSSGAPEFISGFPVDMAWMKMGGVLSWCAWRQHYKRYMGTDTNSGYSGTTTEMEFDYMDGWYNGSENSSATSWMFRRAPGFFDMGYYKGTAANLTVEHNLGVAPEMMIMKSTSGGSKWYVYHASNTADGGNPENDYFDLSTTAATFDKSDIWNDTAPTATAFYLGSDTDINNSSAEYQFMLFASVPGICKVGGYRGNGTSQTIDCGFSSGARFVLIKAAEVTSNWNMFDTERGIVAGNDSRYELNTTDSADTGDDGIDPDSSGFTVNYVASNDDDVNINTRSYIYLAIA